MPAQLDLTTKSTVANTDDHDFRPVDEMIDMTQVDAIIEEKKKKLQTSLRLRSNEIINAERNRLEQLLVQKEEQMRIQALEEDKRAANDWITNTFIPNKQNVIR